MRHIVKSSLVGLGALALWPVSASGQSVGTPEQREQLFEELQRKVMEREAFSPIKEQLLGLDVAAAMEAVRPEIVAAETETELFYALMKLSNTRKDRHLSVSQISGGLQVPGYEVDLEVPLRFSADYGTPGAYAMFVDNLDEGYFASGRFERTPALGDRVLTVNGQPLADYVAEIEPYYEYSTVPSLWWSIADDLSEKTPQLPPERYGDEITYGLQAADGTIYEVTLPYLDDETIAWSRAEGPIYPDMALELTTETYELYRHTARRDVLLLRWFGFKDTLIADVEQLVQHAEANALLDHALIIDATGSRGGSHGAEALSYLTATPFKVTFGNLRLSDVADDFIDAVRQGADRNDREDQRLLAWLEGPVAEALEQGLAYSEAVPFKLQALPADSDGIMQPAGVHFRGPLIAFFGPAGGSHLDQFSSMIIDNQLGWTIGMSTGGFSNTWEWAEEVALPGTEQRLVEFMWSIGQTIRPNGEILEGNPAAVHERLPLTADNFETYHAQLLERAYAYLDFGPENAGEEPEPDEGEGDREDAPGAAEDPAAAGDELPAKEAAVASGCGCATGGGPGGALALIALSAGLLRRARRARS